MLYNSFERVVPLQTNVMVLEHETNGYFYVHRSLYDQAVIMRDKYKESGVDLLVDLIGGNSNFKCIEVFNNSVPEPLDILGYFLALLREDVDDFKMMVAGIHIISATLNMRRMLLMPKSIRSSVVFSVDYLDDYNVSYDRFFKDSVTYSDLLNHNRVEYRTTTTLEDDEEIEEDEDVFDFESLLNDPTIFDRVEEEESVESEPVIDKPVVQPVSVTSESVPTNTAKKSGLDIIAARRREKL